MTTILTDALKERMMQSLTEGTALPPIEGIQIEVTRAFDCSADIRVSLVDGNGVPLAVVFDGWVGEGGSVTLGDFKKAFEIKVG